MALRTYLKAKFLISQDNSANPTQIAFSSGDQEVIDTSTYNEAVSKSLVLAPSAADHQVDLDSIATAAIVYVMVPTVSSGPAPQVSVKMVPTAGILGDAIAFDLKPGIPMIMPSNIIGLYLSNADSGNSAKVIVGAVGN